jgi:hypothetical protein
VASRNNRGTVKQSRNSRLVTIADSSRIHRNSNLNPDSDRKIEKSGKFLQRRETGNRSGLIPIAANATQESYKNFKISLDLKRILA